MTGIYAKIIILIVNYTVKIEVGSCALSKLYNHLFNLLDSKLICVLYLANDCSKSVNTSVVFVRVSKEIENLLKRGSRSIISSPALTHEFIYF